MQQLLLAASKNSGSGFPTDPYAANIILDISARSGSIVDAKGHSLTNTNVVINNTTMKYGPSMAFGGSSYFKIPNTDGTLWLPGDFTIDMWIYLVSKTASYPSVFGNYDTWPQANGMQLFMTHSGASTSAFVAALAGTFPTMTSSVNVTYGNWFHYAVTRASGTMRNYINGVYVGTATTSVSLFGSKTNIYIGAPSDGPTGGGINGYIDRYRITSVARYTGTTTFTPPKF